jgi:hypothetical protein
MDLTMKKPMNRWAILFYVIAACVFLDEAVSRIFFEFTSTQISPPPPTGTLLLVQDTFVTWGAITSGFVGAGVFLACGILIELVDKIRWNTTPPDERKKEHEG